MLFLKRFSEVCNLCSPALKISFFKPSLADLCKGIRFQQSCVSERRPLCGEFFCLTSSRNINYILWVVFCITKWQNGAFTPSTTVKITAFSWIITEFYKTREVYWRNWVFKLMFHLPVHNHLHSAIINIVYF